MSGVPSNVIVPFMGIEFDPSRATKGPGIFPMAVLLFGQKLAAGTFTANTLTQVFSEAEAEAGGGTGSMIHLMVKKFLKNCKTVDLYIVALDDGVGTQATRVLTLTGPATAAGELAIYVNGKRIAISVANEETATEIGDNLVTEFDANFDYLPWTIANVTGTVTLTAKNDGVAAGDNDMRVNALASDQLPAGVGASFAATTPGTVDPDVQDVLDALGSNWFPIWVNPYADDTNLGLIEAQLLVDFGPTVQLDAVCYQAMRGSVATITTFATGAGRNSQSCVLVDAEYRQCATWELVSEIAGQVAKSLVSDPGQPLHRLTLADCNTNDISERRTKIPERNNLASSGVMTLSDDLGVQLEATVTMYLLNSAAAADTAYQHQNTMYNLQYQRWSFNNWIQSRYPRARLVDSAEKIDAGIQVITPEIGKSEAVAWFRALEKKGLVENISQFKDDIICVRDDDNVNRLNWILPPDLANQFIVGSGVLQFLL